MFVISPGALIALLIRFAIIISVCSCTRADVFDGLDFPELEEVVEPEKFDDKKWMDSLSPKKPKGLYLAQVKDPFSSSGELKVIANLTSKKKYVRNLFKALLKPEEIKEGTELCGIISYQVFTDAQGEVILVAHTLKCNKTVILQEGSVRDGVFFLKGHPSHYVISLNKGYHKLLGSK